MLCKVIVNCPLWFDIYHPAPYNESALTNKGLSFNQQLHIMIDLELRNGIKEIYTSIGITPDDKLLECTENVAIKMIEHQRDDYSEAMITSDAVELSVALKRANVSDPYDASYEVLGLLKSLTETIINLYL